MRTHCLLALALSSQMLLACADPEGEFSAFVDRRPVVAQSDQCAALNPLGSAADLQGTFLFAFSSNLNPLLPVLFLADVTSAPDGAGVQQNLTITAIDAFDRATPVGSDISASWTVAPDGSFRVQLPTLVIDGEANPITLHAPITATASLVGYCASGPGEAGAGDAGARPLSSPDFYCGLVRGNVTSPTPLDLGEANSYAPQASVFTMERVPDVSALPLTPRIDCFGALADPPPVDE